MIGVIPGIKSKDVQKTKNKIVHQSRFFIFGLYILQDWVAVDENDMTFNFQPTLQDRNSKISISVLYHL